MSTDFIRYDLLTQEALRGMIRRVLEDAARVGMPGEHHFFITFLTRAPGVRLSPRMLERYPEEMTVVLQHQFWDLKVNEHGFEVGLSFGGVPERLVVPFDSISAFHDPSVGFGLKFEVLEGSDDEDEEDGEETSVVADAADRPAALPANSAPSDAAASAADPAAGAEVVSLDKFRKK